MSETEHDIFKNKYVICGSCGAEMEYKENYAQEHLQKYPDHDGFIIKIEKINLFPNRFYFLFHN